MADLDRLAYTADELAEMLGVTRRHIMDLTREGKLECVRLGRSVRFPRHVIEKLLGMEDQ